MLSPLKQNSYVTLYSKNKILGEFKIFNVTNAHDVIVSMLENKGPYLIFSKPDSNTSLIVALL